MTERTYCGRGTPVSLMYRGEGGVRLRDPLYGGWRLHSEGRVLMPREAPWGQSDPGGEVGAGRVGSESTGEGVGPRGDDAGGRSRLCGGGDLRKVE